MSDLLADLSIDKSLNPILNDILLRLSVLERATSSVKQLSDLTQDVGDLNLPGYDPETGTYSAAGGDLQLDADGLKLFGLRYALAHLATDASGGNPRFGRYEMYLDENGVPALKISFYDATAQTEMVTNGGLETGDTTGHTLTVPAGTTLAVTADAPYAGTYALHGYHHPANGTHVDKTFIDTLNAIAVTPGDRYLFQAYSNVRQTVQIGEVSGDCKIMVSIVIKWYTAGAALISTQSMGGYAYFGGSTGSYDKGWRLITNTATAPATAATAVIIASCEVVTDAAFIYQEWNLDGISLARVPMYRDIHFSPRLSYFNGIYSVPLGGDPVASNKPPVLSAFAWDNQSTTTAVDGPYGITMVSNISNTNSIHMLKQATGATPWTKTVWIKPMLHGVNYNMAGVAFHQSTGAGALVTVGIAYDSAVTGNPWHLRVDKYTNPTTLSINVSKIPIHPTSPICIRLSDDGANRKAEWSVDGVTFEQIYTEARTTFLTADEIGIYVNGYNATYAASAVFMDWE
jgi:hypothetical protein